MNEYENEDVNPGTTLFEKVLLVIIAFMTAMVVYQSRDIGQLKTELAQLRQTNEEQARLITFLNTTNAANSKRIDNLLNNTSGIQISVANETTSDWDHWFNGDDPLASQEMIRNAKQGDVLVMNGQFGNRFAVETDVNGMCTVTVALTTGRPEDCGCETNGAGGYNWVCTIK